MEEYSHDPTVAEIEIGKTIKCPLFEPTNPNTNRRIENDTGLVPDHHAAESSNFVKTPEEVSKEIIVSEDEQRPIQEAEEKNKSLLVVGIFGPSFMRYLKDQVQMCLLHRSIQS